jgi:hypothetical protein
VGSGLSTAWNYTGGEVVHWTAEGAAAAWNWANTPTCLPNPGFITGPLNAAYDGYKIGSGVFLLTAGTAADVTGIGAVLGVPAQAYGVYQVGTGAARIYRGYKQLSGAFSGPEVNKTHLQYGGDSVLNVIPFGGTIIDIIGGLP